MTLQFHPPKHQGARILLTCGEIEAGAVFPPVGRLRAVPAPAVLRQLLQYQPDTGKLFWLPRPAEFFCSEQEFSRWNTRHAGREALHSLDTRGHRHGRILKQAHLAHRVIWAMQTGEWPTLLVDHIDCDRSNNRWSNLRLATPAQNSHNRRLAINSLSRLKGVTFMAKEGKWRARIMVQGRSRSIGWHDTPEEAAAAYAKASAELHGEFGRTE